MPLLKGNMLSLFNSWAQVLTCSAAKCGLDSCDKNHHQILHTKGKKQENPNSGDSGKSVLSLDNKVNNSSRDSGFRFLKNTSRNR